MGEGTGYIVVQRPRQAFSAGIEQEFELFRAGRKVDFRSIFPAVARKLGAVSFRSRDLAAVVDAGYMLACDDSEAEFATAPIELAATGPVDLAREVVRCRESVLDAVLTQGIERVRGYSTHLNVSLSHNGEVALALAVARLVGPPLTLLLEGRKSPGLLIRPRPLRLEIGTEYIDDDEPLVAGIVLLAGAVAALQRGPAALSAWPRARLVRWEFGVLRGGIYLPHHAFGESIYARHRAARIALVGGGTLTAGAILERTAELACAELGATLDARCADILLHLARTPGCLPMERGHDVTRVRRRIPPRASTGARVLALLAESRGSASAPLFVDWHGAAFSVPGAPGMAFGVPWAGLPSFLDLADRRGLAVLRAALPIGGVLRDLSQFASFGVFRGIDTFRLGEQAFHDFGAGSNKKSAEITGQVMSALAERSPP